MLSSVYTRLCLGLLLSIFSFKSLASESNVRCDVKNYLDIVKCIEEKSYKNKVFDYKLKSAQSAKKVSAQWVNPQLGLEKVVKDSEKSETSASLLFTLRLGGKKGAMIDEAESLFQKESIQIGMDQQTARLDSVLSLYRLAHLKREIEIEDETIKTFSKVINQFKRPKLSPEQEVSLSIFKMAIADHEIKIIDLKSDEESLYTRITSLSGLSRSEIAAYLPAQKKNWPDYKPSQETESLQTIKLAEADLKLAQSQLEKAKADAWPDLQVGPSFRQTQTGDEKENFMGASLVIPLPVFNLNGNMKDSETHRVAAAQLEYENTKTQAVSLKSNMAVKYSSLVAVLKKSLTSKSIDENHLKTEKQFFSGLVSGALVIEAHRQFIDFEERRNKAELQALETLGTLYILEKKFDGVVL